MNTISFSPTLQTILTLIGTLATLCPAVVHLAGLDDTPGGKAVLTIGADVVGLWKRLMGPKADS